MDHDPDDLEPCDRGLVELYLQMDWAEVEYILASAAREEELEARRIQEKYCRLRLLYTRALALRRPEDTNSSCPNIHDIPRLVRSLAVAARTLISCRPNYHLTVDTSMKHFL